eukprot:Plantae.Rhodophyta-Rhodochaete_pulchella.ctg16756.p2 GENE.Plantae.Rhodophyta-Rhodochaete_pulchella.ctg16756~~Plantae.Rhodophyta-Rhodochaete_pulchella.ctg16756.p2  ORF type:complete len:165 (+),score=25.81 Plantae.Rhodophyta-Rhodochaete_pulchella.ctg16756:127-621(+)
MASTAFVNVPFVGGVTGVSHSTAVPRRCRAAAPRGRVVMQGEDEKKGGGPFAAFGNMSKFMDTMKKAQSLASSAKDLEAQLKSTEVEAVSDDGLVRVVVTGQQVPLKVDIADELLSEGSEKVSEVVTKTVQQAHAKSVANAQERIRSLSESIGLPSQPPPPPSS